MTAPTLATLGPAALHAIALDAKKDYFRCERQLAACLLEIDRRRLYTEWGASNVLHYAETALGFDPHTAREMLRMARALAALPKLEAAYYGGDIVASKLREITRVAAPHTEEFWLRAAAAHTTHEIELMVARTEKGGLPPDPSGDDPCPVRTRMRLHFEATAFALVTDAIDLARKDTGLPLTREQAIELIAQAYLTRASGRGEEGCRYRVVIHAEPSNRMAWVNTSRGVVFVGDDAFGQAVCDAEILDLREAEDEQPPAEEVKCPTRDAEADEPECPTRDAEADEPECPTRDAEADEPECPTRDAEADELECPTRDAEEAGEPECPTRDAECCSDERSTRDPWTFLASISKGMAPGASAARAKRSVPPAVARHVMARYHNRCAVPGCNLYIWKEIHHITWRIFGGNNDKDNLAPVCQPHHRMLHSAELFLSTTASGDLVWRDSQGRILQGSAVP